MKKLAITLTLAALSSLAIAQGMRPPTCDPRDRSCTMQNGCNGGPCSVAAPDSVLSR